jgi:large subunit ribosomal protein L3
MSLGLIGRKVGMTRVFNDDGSATPVTVIDVANNRVSQVKTATTDGYDGVQVTYGERRASRVNKAAAGHFAKAGVQSGSITREWAVAAGELKPGAVIGVETFQVGQTVDVTGTTKGRGFTGVIRRHHFSSNRETHGNSVTTRAPGSIGMAQDPGRVFPGKRMAGQHGNKQRTTQSLTVVRIDVARGLLLIKGAIPGSAGGHVIVRPTVRS